MNEEKLLPYVVNGDFLEKKIHHIVRTDHFKKMIEGNLLFLKKVINWEDPYDAAILKLDIDYNGTPTTLSEQIKEIYGQCWSERDSECDGLWRVYSNNRANDVVRITTSVRKLLEAVLYSSAHKKDFKDVAIGKIFYKTEEELRKRLVFCPYELPDAVGWGKAFLFHKRKEFSYENEVRLIYSVSNSNVKKEGGICEIPIYGNWADIIEQVQFSPWMCTCKKDELRKLLLKSKFKEETIVSSSLYEKPIGCVPVKPYNDEAKELFNATEKPLSEEQEEYCRIMNAPGAIPESESQINDEDLDKCQGEQPE